MGMNVLTFFTSQKEIMDDLDSFLYTYPKLRFQHKDNDTAYFLDQKKFSLGILFHFEPCDVGYELSTYFTEDYVRERIHSFFGNKEYYIFDISYRGEERLSTLLKDFKEYLKSKGRNFEGGILLHHDLNGFLDFKSIGVEPIGISTRMLIT